MEETHVNFLGGSPLNRLSWLRTSNVFLSAVLESPQTRWILFQAGQPLVKSTGAPRVRTLAQLPTSDIKSLLGPIPVFGQGKELGEGVQHLTDDGVPVSALEASRLHGPTIVFLGLHELDNNLGQSALPSSEFSAKVDPKLAASNISGSPYFALDVTSSEKQAIEGLLDTSKKNGVTLEFAEPRSATSDFSAFEAGVFAEARSMIDWNDRNKFCPACGSPTYSLWAGWKLACASTLPWADNTGKRPCPSAKGVHNFSHPRTDGVVIMAIIDETGENILLGRNRKFPGGFYSTLAGFIEPGESFEDAVKREIWEEAGVRVWGVKYHSTQPWPYPANLMVGFYAFADSSQSIRIDLDNELSDARWFSRSEIRTVLEHPQGARLTRKDYRKFDEEDAKTATSNDKPALSATGHTALSQADPTVQANAKGTAETKAIEPELPPFRVPPPSAIAGVLIRDWADGKIGAGGWQGPKPQKNNL